MFCLDAEYSTTRLVCKRDLTFNNKDNSRMGTVLPFSNIQRKQKNGGLRTQGYFKYDFPDKPLITIVTVVFNGNLSLEKTILSIINQCYSNVEYIIIDGGSNDSTVDIIKKYEFALDYWISEPDKGIYDAMNKGVGLASGSYILFLGSDDKLASDKTLSKVSKLLVEENPVVLFGSVIYDHDNISGKVGEIVKSKFNWNILLHNTVHHQSCFYHKTLFSKWKYDSSLKLIADYELNLITFKKALNVKPVNLIISVCGANGASQNKNNFSTFIRETNMIRKKHINSPLLRFALLILFGIKVLAFSLKTEVTDFQVRLRTGSRKIYL